MSDFTISKDEIPQHLLISSIQTEALLRTSIVMQAEILSLLKHTELSDELDKANLQINNTIAKIKPQ